MAFRLDATLEVIDGGRVTIPVNIRKAEHIEIGDLVKVTIEKIEGYVRFPGRRLLPRHM